VARGLFIGGSLRMVPAACLLRKTRTLGPLARDDDLNSETIYQLRHRGAQLRQGLAPQQVVLPDQFVDRTCNRVSTFFGDGLAAHIAFADPICPDLLDQVFLASRKAGINAVKGGTYVCMEGPAFSTKAESNLYRKWGMDVIGMTNLQEAKLAREAEICYVTMALVTDYDCWHDSHESVTVDMIVGNLMQNSRNAQALIVQTIEDLADKRGCGCGEALRNALITDRSAIPAETVSRIRHIVGRYLSQPQA